MHLNINGLEVVRELGRGASAVVYLARRSDLPVAVKVYHQSTTDQRSRFQHEVAAVATLEHPNITRLLHVGEVDGQPFLVRQYVEGHSLATQLRHGPLAIDQAVSLTASMASALGTAHRRGLIHRDVKPANILLNSTEPVLSDFGLAVREGSDATLAGTLQYAAPEQSGMLHRPMDARTDLYGLGCVLYECLAGHPPFTATDLAELAYQHAASPPPPLSLSRAGVSTALEAVVQRLLRKDPDDRFQSAQELLTALREIAPTLRVAPIVSTPLVGRRAERASLHRVWNAVRRGQGGVAVVEGPSGSGKSALVDAFTAGLGPAQLLQATCVEGEPVPFGPVRRSLNTWLVRQERGDPAARGEEKTALRRAAEGLEPILKRLSSRFASRFADVADYAAGTVGNLQFVEAVATLLLRLSEARPLVWVLHDVHWLDEASRGLVARLAMRLPEHRVLLVATARSEEHYEAPVTAFVEAIGEALRARCTLAGLSAEEGEQLLQALLGDRPPPAALSSELVRRSKGSPLLLREYLRAVIDAGLVYPDWDRWSAVPEWSRRLQLPSEMVEAVLARLRNLSSTSRRVLATAGLIGSTFSVDVLKAVCEEDVHAALGDGVRYELLERLDAGQFRFLHSRIQEAMVGALADTDVRSLHDAIASRLRALANQDDVSVYAIANHLIQGERADLLYLAEACHEAGNKALEDFAPAEAYRFLAEARAARTTAGRGLDFDLEEQYAAAASLTKDFLEFERCVKQLLPEVNDPIRRGRNLASLAYTTVVNMLFDEAEEHTRSGLVALREPPPSRLWQVPLGLWHQAVAALGRVSKTLPNEIEANRLRTLSELYDTWMLLASARNRPGEMFYVIARWYRIAQRLGPSTALAVSSGYVGMLHGYLRRARLARTWVDYGVEVARSLSNPVAVARASFVRGVVLQIIGASSESSEQLAHVTSQHVQWLKMYDFAVLHLYLGAARVELGYAAEALHGVEAAFGDLRASGNELIPNHAGVELMVSGISLSLLGQHEQALSNALQVESLYRDLPTIDHPIKEAFVQQLHAFLQMDQADLGTPLEEVIAQFRASGRRAASDLSVFRPQLVAMALGCLWRALAAEDAKTQKRWRRKLRWATVQLRKLRFVPAYDAHYHAVCGGLLFVKGKPEQALDELGRAERLAADCDCPWARLTSFTLRAHVRRAQGNHRAAKRDGEVALSLAHELGYQARVRHIASTFGLEEASAQLRPVRSSSGSSPLLSRPTVTDEAESLEADRSRRLANALLTVSLASASSLEPQQQARSVLGELTRLLGAERARFFSVDTESGQLVQVADTGEDPSPVSQTVLRRVVATREPLILTSSDEGEVLGARSVVLQGLRSIIAAPLLVREHLVGVVYLDSRLANGVFNAEDVELLLGMANHIAIAVEMARAANLEHQTLRRAREAAEAANRAKDQFLANMSHELRTPLNAILGYTEMVAEELVDSEQRELCEDLEQVHIAAVHLLTIIDDVLDLTRISAGQLEFEIEEVDLEQAVAAGVALALPEAVSVQDRVTVALASDARRVLADAKRLRQVLANLISNAAKFSDRETIHVSSRAHTSNCIELVVQDKGIGIPAESLSHVFERFHQADNSHTRRHDGTGLGLAICKEFVERMQGSIRIESTEGVGTIVRVQLPSAARPAASDR
ncbi:MAG: ATP-binding protein [Myxococcota bacterium]